MLIHRFQLAVAAVLIFMCIGCGCAKSMGDIMPNTGSTTPKGDEPNLVLIYLDDSSSVDTSGPKNTSRRSEYFTLASEFIRGLKPEDAKQTAVTVSTFQVNTNPLSDLTMAAKTGILKSLVKYKKSETERDPSMKGTSMLAVFNDAEKRIDAAKPGSVTVLILTDGATEDQAGGDLAAFKAKAQSFAGTKGLHMAIAGISGMQNGQWRRFLGETFADHADIVKLGKSDVDSQSVVQWAAERYNEAAGTR